MLLVLSNEEKTSLYIANKDGDNIPPCRTPLVILKYEVDKQIKSSYHKRYN